MKERPILFSGPMVRAILEGKKSMTRRIVKPQPETMYEYAGSSEPKPKTEFWFGNNRPLFADSFAKAFCPFGAHGDRLIVRETWSPDHAEFYPHYPVVYKADGYPADSDIENGTIESPEAGGKRFPFKWRPSIHMPHRLSRLTLEITRVRVERLKEISKEDVVAEGFPFHSDRDAMSAMWDKLNGKGSWESSPWVWVVSFRRIEGAN